jgi:hypothetical protein
MLFLMQARSSVDLTLKAWVSANPDFAGTGFPGPGLPEYIAVSKRILSSEAATTSPPGAKEGVRATTTGALPAYTRAGNVLTASANGALSAALLDNVVALAVGQRFLLRGEHLTSHAHAGIYTLTAGGSGGAPWSFTRAIDFDSAAEVRPGTHFWILEGDKHGGELAVLVLPAAGAIVVNTTGLTFETFDFGGCEEAEPLELEVRDHGEALEGANSVLDFKGGGVEATWHEGSGAYVVTVPGTLIENSGTPDGGAGGGAINFIGGALSVWNAGKNRHDVTVSALPPTDTPGAMAVYQGAGEWAAVVPGSKAFVWTVDEVTGLPGWSEPAEGGGEEVQPTIFYDEGTAKTERHAIDVVGRDLAVEDVNPALAYNASGISSFAAYAFPLAANIALPGIADPLLLVSVGVELASGSISTVSVAYAGIRMRPVTSHTSGSLRLHTFALASNELPSVAGTYPLTVQIEGSSPTINAKLGHAWIAGAGLKVPIHAANANGTGTAIANAIGAAGDSILVDFAFAAADGTVSGTVAGSQTERQDSDVGNSWMGISTLAGAGATTMNWTLSTSSAWLSTAVEVPVSLARTRIRDTAVLGKREYFISGCTTNGPQVLGSINLAELMPQWGVCHLEIWCMLNQDWGGATLRMLASVVGRPGSYTIAAAEWYVVTGQAAIDHVNDLRISNENVGQYLTLAIVGDALTFAPGVEVGPTWHGIYVDARPFPRVP